MRPVIAALLLTFIATAACGKPAPKSIEQLRALDRNVSLTEVGDVDGGLGFSAKLYRYESAGLRVHALVARPASDPPEGGWPVVIANHGHHPDPKNHGITAEGKDHRPGDYYRRIPELFVARGYLVVMPDYRGHNISEGFEFTEGLLEGAYYPEDVLNLISAIGDVPDADTDQLYMWGHSMGGMVTMRTLLVTDRIRAATLWSSTNGDLREVAEFYTSDADLRAQIGDLSGPFDTESVNPYNYLDDLETPVIIQHAVGDGATAYEWSERLAKDLEQRDKTYEFWSFDTDNHLFSEENMEVAADRDVAFFRRFAD